MKTYFLMLVCTCRAVSFRNDFWLCLLLLTLTGFLNGGCVSIHEATRRGDLDRVKAIVEHNPSDINRRDEVLGATPLHLAVLTKERREIAHYLISKGADVRIEDNSGLTALHDVCDPVVAKQLIDAGADVNAHSKGRGTPLQRAKDVDVAKLLIDAGADVNVCFKDGNTPLHIAYKRNNTNLVELLIKHGAKTDLVNKEFQLPQDLIPSEKKYSGPVLPKEKIAILNLQNIGSAGFNIRDVVSKRKIGDNNDKFKEWHVSPGEFDVQLFSAVPMAHAQVPILLGKIILLAEAGHVYDLEVCSEGNVVTARITDMTSQRVLVHRELRTTNESPTKVSFKLEDIKDGVRVPINPFKR